MTNKVRVSFDKDLQEYLIKITKEDLIELEKIMCNKSTSNKLVYIIDRMLRQTT